MYTLLFMHTMAILLLTKNWFVGGVLLITLTLVVTPRLKNEEVSMIEKFGDGYREYMKHTGQFLPRLRN